MQNQNKNRPIILFVAEAVTLAHFARTITLAKSIDPNLYKIIVASDPRFIGLEGTLDFDFYPIRSISSEEFMQTLEQGKPLYSSETLFQYVNEDLLLFDSVKPDLVIGDFRLSLAVSAPVRKIPYISIVNAYWSPFSSTAYPVPDIPITRILGVNVSQKLFDLVRPIVFALHARPLNRVRQHFGLPSLGFDLRKIYSWGDYTLYADVPELIPTFKLPENHRYIGPVLWSAHNKLPEWWTDLPEDKPIVFLILGSSGQAELLPMVLESMSHLSVTVIVATAGKITLTDVPGNAYVTDYLPMDIATQRSQLVICNGGSLTTYQALISSTPVIGLCSNMDQLINMVAIEQLGCGFMLRATEATATDLAAAVLNAPSCTQAVNRISHTLKQTDSGKRFREIVAEILL